MATNALIDYFSGIALGSTVACRKMRKLSERIIFDYDNPGKYHFDHTRAERAVDFIERFCKQPAGNAGAALVLEPFERAIIQTIFGFVDEQGYRRYREVMIVIARKNGKTTLCSAIELYMLLMDGEGTPKVYNIATKHEQAMLGFEAAYNMVLQSPTLTKYIRKRAYDLYASRNLGTIKALSSNTKSLDGLDVHCGIIDELSAITNRDIYDLVRQGTSSRRQPLLFTITTNGYVRENIFDDQYRYASDWTDEKIKDEHFIAFIYELDEREEWTDETVWVKANPGLGTIKQTSSLRSNVEKAKADPAFLPTVLTKDFNLFENTATAFLTWEEIENPLVYDIKDMGFKYAVAGIDLSSTVDLTAVSLLMKRRCKDELDPHIYMTSMYWLPESVVDTQSENGLRTERDRVPYTQWIRSGLMQTCPGNRIDKKAVLRYLQEFQKTTGIYIYLVGYDPWGIESYLLDDLRVAFGTKNVIEVRQGYKTESPALKSLKAEMREKLLVHNQNPIDMWCMRNAAVKTDDNANIMLCKKENKGAYRIDGFAALLDAYVVLRDNVNNYEALL
ncbi:MAG: terminase large subunit [Coriobacteriales bacterium]|jgi:phage terminase large subunit-like protein|nr:terminase large subunit [Coriobacteriales bacterium]